MDTKPSENNKKLPEDAGENPYTPDIRRIGYLKKLKTMKKKFFVLREDSSSGPARLEYYDNEKKWRSGAPPKQVYEIRCCFNINRKLDAKHKHVLALYTKDKCFSLIMADEEELKDWLMVMLELQNGQPVDGANPPKPNFEHVWQVDIKCRGLGSSRNMAGRYQLCLTEKVLTLVKKKAQPNEQGMLKLPLWSVRRCGHSEKFFYIELGRTAITGAGELWMQTEDMIIAQNIHETILRAMRLPDKASDDIRPLARHRSASTSEKSKPIATRRPVGVVSPQQISSILLPPASGRERCDSMPTRIRTVSEGHHDVLGTSPNSRMRHSSHLGEYESMLPHRLYGRTASSYSPPNNPLGFGLGAYFTDSAGSSHSIDDFETGDFVHSRYGHSLQQEGGIVHTEPSIREENAEEYLFMGSQQNPATSQRPSRIIPSLPLDTSNASSRFCSQSSLSSEGVAEVGTPGEYLNMVSPVYRLHASMPSMGRNSAAKSLDLGSSPSSPGTAQSDYVDMASPSSHPEDPDEYVPMSPLGISTSDSSFCQETSTPGMLHATAQNTPDSLSFVEEYPDGYIPMAPGVGRSDHEKTPSQLSDEGYLSMAPLSTSLPKSVETYMEMASPKCGAQSLQDVTLASSPRPEKLEHFRLDKVKSYISPSEDESTGYIKPVRAYSIGSRPQLRKSHLSQHLEAARVRACSVGSQAKPSFRKGPTPIETELGTLKDFDSKASRKSSSAPLLGGTPTSLRARIAASKYEEVSKIEARLPSLNAAAATLSENDKTRRYSVGSRQRSNSRSSAGPSPMSSLTEFLENLDSKEKAAEVSISSPLSTTTHSSVADDSASNQYVEMSCLPVDAVNLPLPDCQGSTMTSTTPQLKEVPASAQSLDLEGDYVDLDLRSQPFSFFSSSSITSNVSLVPTSSACFSSNSVPTLSPVTSAKHHDYVNLPEPGKSSCSTNLCTGDSSPKACCHSPRGSSGHCDKNTGCCPSPRKDNSPSPRPNSKRIGNAAHSIGLLAEQRSPNPSDVHSSSSSPSFASKPILEPPTFSPEVVASCPCMTHAHKSSSSSAMKCSESGGISRQHGLSVSPVTVSKCKKSSSSSSPNRNSWTSGSSSGEDSGLLAFLFHSSSKDKIPGLVTSDASYENLSVGSSSAPGSRPPSVSSELNYASLDLTPSSCGDNEKTQHSPCSLKDKDLTDKNTHLTYAEIDFTKSEGLRNTSGNLREGRD